MNKQRSVILLLLLLTVSLTPLPASAQLVSCGNNGQADCTFKDLVELIILVINYLISLAAIVAIFLILVSGFKLVTAAGVPERISSAKDGLRNAIIGFVMIITAFVIINLIVKGLLGSQFHWWDPACIYTASCG